MAPISLQEIVAALPSNDNWGPPTSTESMINGVPYAPYSKGDKLGRMADWTEGKDRDHRGRTQYGGRNYRGILRIRAVLRTRSNMIQTSKRTAPTRRTRLRSKLPRKSPPFLSSTTLAPPLALAALAAEAGLSFVGAVSAVPPEPVAEAPSSVWVAAVDRPLTTIVRVAIEAAVEAGVTAGEMINRSATGMLQSLSSRTGPCWKRSTLLG